MSGPNNPKERDSIPDESEREDVADQWTRPMPAQLPPGTDYPTLPPSHDEQSYDTPPVWPAVSYQTGEVTTDSPTIPDTTAAAEDSDEDDIANQPTRQIPAIPPRRPDEQA